jgi:hypothetical protein
LWKGLPLELQQKAELARPHSQEKQLKLQLEEQLELQEKRLLEELGEELFGLYLVQADALSIFLVLVAGFDR